jgi:competence protein ComEC
MVKLPSSIHEVPFIRIALPFIIGILFQYKLHIFTNFWLLGGVSIMLILVLAISIWFLKSWKFRWVSGLLIYFLIFSLGCFATLNSIPKSNISSASQNNYLARIVDEPSFGEKSVRAKAEIYYQNDTILNRTIKVLIYFSTSDSSSYHLRYGDIIAIAGKLTTFSKPLNPYQFNYKAYMLQQGIAYCIYANTNYWEKIGNNANPVFRLAYDIRNKAIETFRTVGVANQELAVVSALLLGNKSLLNDETRQVYSTVGAMHILAVSGLHVGLIYGLVLIILSLLPNQKLWKFTRLLIALLALWGFAFITGLSPSVQRATIMFSLFAIGKALKLKTNSYNTLAASAFLILVINPLSLFHIGFQLSHAAVLSIFFFYPPIYSLVDFKHKIFKYVWTLISLSLAAQILTLPFTLYYFGQFPLLFLVTNIVAIPLATITLYIALGTLIFSFVKPAGIFFGKLLNLLTWCLNQSLQTLESIPYSCIKSIYFNQWQATMLTIAIAFFALLLVLKNRKYLIASVVFLWGVLMLSVINNISISRNSEIVILSSTQGSIFCINEGGTPVMFYTPEIADKAFEFATEGYQRNKCISKMKVSKIDSFAKEDLPGFVSINNRFGLATIVYRDFLISVPYNDSVSYLVADNPLDVDILIANKYTKPSILNLLKPKIVIFDGSIKPWQKKGITSILNEKGISHYDIKHQGYYSSSF